MDPLFHNGELRIFFEQIFDAVIRRVDSINEDQFIHTDNEKLVKCIFSECQIEPLEIYKDSISMQSRETKINKRDYGSKINVDGIEINIQIPYTGERELWNLQPSKWQLNFPKGIVRKPKQDGVGLLEINFQRSSETNPISIKRDINDIIDLIQANIQQQKKDIEEFQENYQKKLNSLSRTEGKD